MPDERIPELSAALRWGPFPPRIGDPPVILEAIMQEMDESQRPQALGLYLDSVAETLQVNLKFVQGLRSLMGGGGQ